MQISAFTKALVAVTLVAAPLSAQPSRDEEAMMLRAQAFSSLLDWPSAAPSMRVFLAALQSARDVAGPNSRSGLAASGWEVRRPIPDVTRGTNWFGGSGTPEGSGQGFVNPPDNSVITTTPEPASMALLATGLVLMAAVTIRSRARKA